MFAQLMEEYDEDGDSDCHGGRISDDELRVEMMKMALIVGRQQMRSDMQSS
jgi:hypothetical protein